MLVLLTVVILALASSTTVSGAQNSLVSCAIWGDPYLMQFVLNQETTPTTVPCDIPKSPTVFFRNKYIEVRVVNEGGMYGNIIAFSVALFEESTSDDDVCTFNEHDFKSSERQFTCGSANVSIDSSMIIYYPLADLRMDIHNRGNHYSVNLYTSPANANISRGLCRTGCPKPKPTSVRSLPSHQFSENPIISSKAEQICDIYLQEFIGSNSRVPENLKEFVQSTRRACITDVSIKGSKKYAEEAVTNIVSTLMTLNVASIELIQIKLKEASLMIERINKIADQITSQLVSK